MRLERLRTLKWPSYQTYDGNFQTGRLSFDYNDRGNSSEGAKVSRRGAKWHQAVVKGCASTGN